LFNDLEDFDRLEVNIDALKRYISSIFSVEEGGSMRKKLEVEDIMGERFKEKEEEKGKNLVFSTGS
jgi:hypothetical protein